MKKAGGKTHSTHELEILASTLETSLVSEANMKEK